MIMANFLITLFLGPFGVHQFIKGEKILGIIYLCTFGLFGIGWLVDIIAAFNDMKADNMNIPNNSVSTTKSSGTPYDAILLFWKKHPQVFQNITDYKDATSNEYLLYGKTLILWGFDKARPLPSDYPCYFEGECHISNPLNLQSSLVKQGYISKAPTKAILFSYTIPKLKMIADSIGCSKKGNKAELVAQVYSSLSTTDLENIYDASNLYILSDKGFSFLNENYDYVNLHKHWKYNISLSEYNKRRFCGNKKRTFNDTAYTILSERVYSKMASFNYYNLNQDYFALYEIAFSEGRYDLALNYYLQFLYLKSCCIFEMTLYNPSIHISVRSFEHTIIFTSHDAPVLSKLAKYYDSIQVDNIYNQFNQPPSFFEINVFKQMIQEMLTEIIFDYEKYNKLIRNELKAYVSLL